jgi:hypothetical protein
VDDPVAEEEVVLGARVDVRDAPAVAQDLDLVVEAGDPDQPRPGQGAGQQLARPQPEPAGRRQRGQQRAAARPAGYRSPPSTRAPVGPGEPARGSIVMPARW